MVDLKTQQSAFEKLIQIVAKLRDPQDGCPWDREQTHQSLKPYLIEESYEVIDAIDQQSDKLKEELGDVLLQVLLHSQIASEVNSFDVYQVIEELSQKLIYRHPHVFSDATVKDSAEVLQNWERLKQKKKKEGEGVLASVPATMPSLLRAHRIGEKVARIGFDWETPADICLKVKEEVEELLNCPKETGQTTPELEEEFGDVLFTIAQLARKLGLNSENVLRKACEKFIRRFTRMEQLAKGQDLSELETNQLEKLWQVVKNESL